MYILHIFPLPQLIATYWAHLIRSIFKLNLQYIQDNYLYIIKKPTSSWILDKNSHLKKVPFRENFTTQFFLKQSALLPPKLKHFLFCFWQYHVKAEGCEAKNPVEGGAVHRLVLLCADERVVEDEPLRVLLVAGYHLNLDTVGITSV